MWEAEEQFQRDYDEECEKKARIDEAKQAEMLAEHEKAMSEYTKG